VEYAGGFTDMLAQRRAAAAAIKVREPKAASGPAEAIAPPPAVVAPKRKLSFKERHALETLPKTIAALTASADALQKRLEGPDFYLRDRHGFEAATRDLGSIRDQLVAAEDEWLTLELLRSELEG
jgi:ATP-binding cassette subfamily F protein uup